ncbi:ABC transporter ATP-binding protein [Candidatus Aerophobetes bacterium]|uniref:ABC transporter ATP-binding protein n=1 Tax=Aerophobetes bacterium TaxID=2030807 RepID=A0A662DEP2_UNCAE|nr:MAG: ABC transporter ATP-binding protein [Candidatus Aerophobetes bacterium]
MALLEIRNLTKKFGGLTAVDNLDLILNEGEIFGLIGPNGAGKTTAFNAICGFYTPDSGSVIFKGENIEGLRPDLICKKGIGRVFQIVKPFKDMNVLANVMVGAFCRREGAREAKEKAQRVLEFIGLSAKKDFPADSLTLADRKRLELARALATEPKLLLLDELFAGLNPKEVEEAVVLIRKIREEGITIFLIEHVMQAVMNLSERIAVLHHGKKIAEGSPKEISTNEEVIKAYLGEEYVIT